MNTLPIRPCRPTGRGAFVTGSRQLHGAYILEVAITLSVFIMLVLAVIEMAFLILAYTTVGHLSQQGLRFAMVRGSQAEQENSLREEGGDEREDIPKEGTTLEDIVKDFVHDISTLKPVENVEVDVANNGNKPGDPVVVTVTYEYQPMVIPGSGWFVSPTLSSSSVGTFLY